MTKSSETRFLPSFMTAVLSAWSKVAAGAPATVLTSHVGERNGGSEPELGTCIRREAWKRRFRLARCLQSGTGHTRRKGKTGVA